MKFAMEQDTLVRLGQRSATENDDLGTLVQQLVESAEPLEGQFNGPAKAAFNKFKANTDQIAASLNGALAGIVTSISGQNTAFVTGAEEGASTHESSEGASDFGGEAFLQRISLQA